MSTDRLSQLQAMLAAEPGDPFLRYAIALEHKRAGRMEQAIADLEGLITEDPKYIACYHQLALLLADGGQVQEAAEACHAGSMQCLVTGDVKARAELLALRNALLDEE